MSRYEAVTHLFPAVPGCAIPAWTVADRLRKAREHAGLRQAELAQMIGISRSSIVTYERDRIMPSRPVVLSWSMATGVPAAWLLDGES